MSYSSLDLGAKMRRHRRYTTGVSQLTFEFKILTFHQSVLMWPIIVESITGFVLQD